MLAQSALSHANQAIQVRDARLARGRQILRAEIEALEQLTSRLDSCFVAAVEQLVACRGNVVVTGIGKAGIVGQKFSASLSSTGTPSHFLHPAEAIHGDLGCVRSEDVVVLFSYSGETEEVVRLIPLLQQCCAGPAAAPHRKQAVRDGKAPSPITIAITSDSQSTLARHSDFVVSIGRQPEACSLGLAPSCTTTAMLALSDAIALVTSESKGFTRQQFARVHPGGNLGRQLARVTEVMRPLSECRVASQTMSVRDVFVQISRPGRRTGAIMLIDERQRLSGIFTDSDLARILESQQDQQLDRPVCEVMSRHYHTISAESYLSEAIQIFADLKISELPVVGVDLQPLGIVDITDVVDTVAGTPEGDHAQLEPTTRQLPTGETTGVPRILSLIKYRKECI